MKNYADVVIISKSKEIDNFFTYEIVDEFKDTISLGDKVLVPFGRGNSLREGYVFGFKEKPDYKRIKAIKYLLKDDINLSKNDVELCKWLRKRYLCTYSEAIKTIIPSGTTLKRSEIYHFLKEGKDLIENEKMLLDLLKESGELTYSQLINQTDISNIRTYLKRLEKKDLIKKEYDFKSEVKEKFVLAYSNIASNEELLEYKNSIPQNYNRQHKLIDYILKNDSGKLKNVNKVLDIDSSVFRRFEELGLIEIDEVREKRKFEKLTDFKKDDFKELNYEQQVAFDQILNSVNKQSFDKFLLHGITGSGKTEIYMHLVNKVLKMGHSCLILVPEISLTPQMIERFTNRFGEKIALLHSKLSLGERFDEWKSIKNGKKKIVIGARSAVFSPAKDVKLIVIDEEHETTYKSDMNPKYETKEVAEKILKENNGTLLLGSATPSVDSYYETLKNDMELLKLNYRINNVELPQVEVVDMGEELNSGNKSIFSNKLYSEIENTLAKNEQVILFHNLKGHSKFISCRNCGHSFDCPRCEISLTYYKARNIAECSYCGYSKKIPRRCPECNSKNISHFRWGTEKIEEIVQNEFNDYNVARLDSDNTKQKGKLQRIVNDFKNNKYQILLGTQMVTKGFDFENVTLVGVLVADLSLNFPDYSASEKTFQLLTQVAGRAGRGDKKGKVVFQTYKPDHYAIKSASKHDYDGFVENELKIRNAFEYPPFVEIINLLFVSPIKSNVVKDSKRFNNLIRKKTSNIDVEIFGPNPALFQRINNKFRYQIFIKAKGIEYFKIKDIIKEEMNNFEFSNNVYLSIDVKPRNLL